MKLSNQMASAIFVVFAQSAGAAHFFQKPCDLYFAAEIISENAVISAESSPSAFYRSQSRMRDFYVRYLVTDIVNNQSPYRHLPIGIDPVLLPGFKALWRLAKHPTMYFKLLQRLEMSVFLLAREKRLSLEEAFGQYLLKEEAYYGFDKPVIVDNFLTPHLFLNLVRQGFPIMDMFYKDKPHSISGHRVQSLLQAAYMEELFRDAKLYSRMYRYMGDAARFKELNWTATRIDSVQPRKPEDPEYPDLFGYLYDTPFFRQHRIDPADFSNPEFFSGMRALLPGLRGWR